MSTLMPTAAVEAPPRFTTPGDGGLRIVRPTNRAAALGLTVSHLMSKPAFAALRFGSWSQVLVGQINRGHYCLVVDDGEQVRGFLGWALCSEALADAWLTGRDFAGTAAREGDCIVFNAWSGETQAANHLVLKVARSAMLGRRLAYFRRVYPDGTSRPMRMPVNAFVSRKLAVPDL